MKSQSCIEWVVYEFLSHLCGDEARLNDGSSVIVFLSHLCGDEGVIKFAMSYFFFLSHLCGDEEELYLKKFSYKKAWRVKHPILPSVFNPIVTF